MRASNATGNLTSKPQQTAADSTTKVARRNASRDEARSGEKQAHKMKTSTSTSATRAGGAYAHEESLLLSHGWAMPIIIEDDDLMFGGKALSEWHEQDASRASDEEEHRGRARVRQYHAPHPPTSHKSDHYYPHHHQHEVKPPAQAGPGAQSKKSSSTGAC